MVAMSQNKIVKQTRPLNSNNHLEKAEAREHRNGSSEISPIEAQTLWRGGGNLEITRGIPAINKLVLARGIFRG